MPEQFRLAPPSEAPSAVSSPDLRPNNFAGAIGRELISNLDDSFSSGSSLPPPGKFDSSSTSKKQAHQVVIPDDTFESAEESDEAYATPKALSSRPNRPTDFTNANLNPWPVSAEQSERVTQRSTPASASTLSFRG